MESKQQQLLVGRGAKIILRGDDVSRGSNNDDDSCFSSRDRSVGKAKNDRSSPSPSCLNDDDDANDLRGNSGGGDNDDDDYDMNKMNNNNIFEKKEEVEDQELRSPLTTCVSFDAECNDNDNEITHIPIHEEEDNDFYHRHASSTFSLRMENKTYRSPSPCLEKLLFPSTSLLTESTSTSSLPSSSLRMRQRQQRRRSLVSSSSAGNNRNATFLPSLQMRLQRS